LVKDLTESGYQVDHAADGDNKIMAVLFFIDFLKILNKSLNQDS